MGIWRGGIGCVVDFYFLKWDMGGEVLGVWTGLESSDVWCLVDRSGRLEDGQEEQVK